MLMRYLLVFLLLTAFIPVSVLGHAGFQVLGIHSHCNCQTSHHPKKENHKTTCDHRHDSHNYGNAHLASTRQWPSRQPSERPQSPSRESHDCVLCQFLSHAKPPIIHIYIPECVPSPIFQKLVSSNNAIDTFDFFLRPIPRGPPAHVS